MSLTIGHKEPLLGDFEQQEARKVALVRITEPEGEERHIVVSHVVNSFHKSWLQPPFLGKPVQEIEVFGLDLNLNFEEFLKKGGTFVGQWQFTSIVGNSQRLDLTSIPSVTIVVDDYVKYLRETEGLLASEARMPLPLIRLIQQFMRLT